MCRVAELVPVLYWLRTLTSSQDRVSGESNFSPLSNCKWAFNYKLAVLTALGKKKTQQSFEIKSWRISISKADLSISALEPSIFICVQTHVAFNYLVPKFCTEISEIWLLDANSNSCQAPKCFRHHVWMFAECRGLKSRVMVLESIQSFVNTALQPDTMPGSNLCLQQK